jgi:pullulanase-type alpha-1,6-glucosidase
VLVAVPEASRTMDASAFWLDAARLRWPQADVAARTRLLYSASGQVQAVAGGAASGFDEAFTLQRFALRLPARTEQAFAWVGPGPQWAVPPAAQHRLRTLHRGQLVLVQEDTDGQLLRSTAVQHAAALDALYRAAQNVDDLGIQVAPATRTPGTRFKLWAPTAQNVALCLYADGMASTPAVALQTMLRDNATGVWHRHERADLSGQAATYVVDVFVRGVGLVRQRVTDPYSLSLNTGSQRSWIGRLDAPDTQPAGWRQSRRPALLRAATDMAIYELQVRDFSVSDTSVQAAWRGKYLAFTETQSDGMGHLLALAQAGITDIHLRPVFAQATAPEAGCTTPDADVMAAVLPVEGGAAETPHAQVLAAAATDCSNSDHDPWHFAAPEGSYASDARDGAVRVREFRAMVQALHAAELRVGMVLGTSVAHHPATVSGQSVQTVQTVQSVQSVMDRIVPGYYQRLNAQGVVERDTCCDNTATEHAMTTKLLIDSAVVWARDYRIDSFRFDLVGHQPRAALQRLQKAVDRAAGRRVQLIDEGGNFSAVRDSKRFAQASQLNLSGTGITTFSDHARVQLLALATTAFSQGMTYFHAGSDLLRSESLDQTLQEAHITPGEAEIQFVQAGFLDLLRMRASSRLFRLDTSAQIRQRLRFIEPWPKQRGNLVAAHLDGRGLQGAGWRDVVYAINTGTEAADVAMPALRGRALRLHPVQAAATAGDPRPAAESRWDAGTGSLRVPARTALVYVAD